jgi:MATE family multidrug resistance protein
MSSAWIIFLIFVVTDTTQGIASSVLRASGKQQYGALLTFIAYFVLGIPLSIYLVFWNEMSIFGLWCGPTLACGFNTVVYIIIFSKIDWKILIEKG